MKQTKNCLAPLLALLMLLSLTACGSSGDDSQDEKKEYTAGVVDGSTYTSEFAGITCTLSESWIFLSQDEIAQIGGVASDLTTDEKLKESLNSGATIYEMYAMDSDSTSLNITVGDLGVIYGTVLDVKDYASSAADQMPSAMESIGMENVTAELTTVTFAGQQQTAIAVTASFQSVPMYEVLVCLKQGNYIYNVTVCSYGSDRTAEVLALFQAL